MNVRSITPWPARTFRHGKVIVAAAAGSLALGSMLMASFPWHVRHAAHHQVTQDLSPAWIVRCGLDPNTLAAAGVTAQQASAVVANAKGYIADHLEALTEDFASGKAALIAAATADLSQGQRDALATIGANRRHRVPLKYCVVNRTEAQWVALRDALATVRIASHRGESPDESATTLVASADGDTTVTAAAGYVANNGAGVKSAWASALGVGQ